MADESRSQVCPNSCSAEGHDVHTQTCNISHITEDLRDSQCRGAVVTTRSAEAYAWSTSAPEWRYLQYRSRIRSVGTYLGAGM